MEIDKAQIISEIRRIASEHGGKPPGRLVFERKTGIKYSDWYPYIWLRWNEALEEAVILQINYPVGSKTR